MKAVMEQKENIAKNTWTGSGAAAWLRELIEQGELTPRRTLITAADMVEESLLLVSHDFPTVVVDTSKEALSRHKHTAQLQNLSPTLIHADLFGCSASLFGPVELIWERSLFHRLPPAGRPDWAHKTARILPRGGRLLGLFQVGRSVGGPPYAVTLDILEKLMKRHFVIESLLPVGEAEPGESQTYRGSFARK